jgi:hypothetical protein
MIDYDELLNQWGVKILKKADECTEKASYEDTNSWKDGYYKGLSEAFIISVTELNMLEKKFKHINE